MLLFAGWYILMLILMLIAVLTDTHDYKTWVAITTILYLTNILFIAVYHRHIKNINKLIDKITYLENCNRSLEELFDEAQEKVWNLKKQLKIGPK